MKGKMYILTTVIILLTISGWIYSIYYGTPWDAYQARIKIDNYLKSRYKKEMIITDVRYEVKKGHYLAVVNPKDNKNIVFYVRIKDEKPFFADEYYSVLWQEEIKQKSKSIINSQLVNDAFIYVECNNNEKYYENPVITNDEYKNNSELVNYVKINIVIGNLFDNSQEKEEYKKIYNMLMELRKLEINKLQIRIRYGKDYSIDNEGSINFNIDNENLKNIKSVDDIETLIS